MKHLRLFETQEAFEAAKESIEKPWVSLTEDDEKVHFMVLEPTPTIECVDLGLPSGKKWMKYNLGATSETEYGDYYQFGSVTPNTNTPCNWAHAPFNNGSSEFDETYFNAHKSEWFDENDNLKSDYDAVYQATNGAAHMPTKADFQELIDNTNSEWIEDYEGSGVNGRIFRSMTDMDKYIFIPASGYRIDTSVYGQSGQANLWSSSRTASDPFNAFDFSFYSVDCGVSDFSRDGGFCLRGVL